MKPVKPGKATPYPAEYNPNLLEIVERDKTRKLIAFNPNSFSGSDLWTCYEFSWLNENQLPQRTILTIEYDMQSPNIIESKSLKYYLFSFSNLHFASKNSAIAKLEFDLSNTLKGVAKVLFYNAPRTIRNSNTIRNIDRLNIPIHEFEYSPELLKSAQIETRQIVLSSLLKSNCPITGQPDWATVYISIGGKTGVTEESLLRYIVSFRNQNEFHEQCVERMIVDLKQATQSESITIYARYSRRGGIDINPIRYCGKICSVIEKIYNQNKQMLEIDLYQ